MAFGKERLNNMPNIIQFKKLSQFAVSPTRAYEHAAGWDLYAAEDFILRSLERRLVLTDLSVHIPEGYYGRIAPRSGLAVKFGIDVLAGIIDSDYRGNVGVVLINLNPPDLDPFDSNEVSDAVVFKRGDKIAQFLLCKYEDCKWEEVDDLSFSVRGEKGFGSSSVKP